MRGVFITFAALFCAIIAIYTYAATSTNRAHQLQRDGKHNEAHQLYEVGATFAISSAQLSLALYHLNGEHFEHNPKEAVYWLEQASAMGNPNAKYTLGVCMLNGIGTEQNLQNAIKLFTQSANQGNSRAQLMLGNLYFFGQGVSRNPSKAAEWYAVAARAGELEAQYNIGVCYSSGMGVEQDEERAAYWYRMAAEQGHEVAQDNIEQNEIKFNQESNSKSLFSGNLLQLGMKSRPSTKKSTRRHTLKALAS